MTFWDFMMLWYIIVMQWTCFKPNSCSGLEWRWANYGQWPAWGLQGLFMWLQTCYNKLVQNWSVACINWVTCKKWIWENRHWNCGHANG